MQETKLFWLGNAIQTLNVHLLLQGEGSSGQLKHSWDGSAAQHATPCHGTRLGWNKEHSQAGEHHSTETKPVRDGPSFTHTEQGDERRLGSSYLLHPHPHQCFPLCCLQHPSAPGRGPEVCTPTSSRGLVQSPCQPETSFCRNCSSTVPSPL